MVDISQQIELIDSYCNQQSFRKARKLAISLLGSIQDSSSSPELALFYLRWGTLQAYFGLGDSKKAFLRCIQIVTGNSLIAAQSLNRLAHIAIEGQNYAEADAYIEEALSLLSEPISDEDELTCRINLLLSRVTVYAESGKPQQAELLLEAVTETYNERCDQTTKQSCIVDLLRTVHLVEQSKRNYLIARDALNKALEICQIMNKVNTLDGAQLLTDLAISNTCLGDFTTGLKFYRQSLAIYKDLLGIASPVTKSLMVQLAIFLDNQGQTIEALMLYRKIIHVETLTGCSSEYKSFAQKKLGTMRFL